MRKKRAFIYDDDPLVLSMLSDFFRSRNYDTLSYLEPHTCPVYMGQNEHCENLRPCGDIFLTDFHLPNMSGLDMILLQEEHGCKVDIRNKAVMSGFMNDGSLSVMEEKKIPFFRKPFKLSDLDKWLAECDTRIDLTQHLGMKRRSIRSEVQIDVSFLTNEHVNVFNGLVANISPEGLKLYTEHELRENQTVRFKTSLPNACSEARVRWVTGGNGLSYTAGLICSSHVQR